MNEGHWFTGVICLSCHSMFDVPVYCGDRFCPVCSKPRLGRIRSRLKWLTSRIKLTRGRRIKHLTLTIQNAEDLPLMVKTLISSFRKLRNRAYWRNNVIGGAYVIEVTGRPHNWHAHIHAVIESYYLDFWRILKMWRTCSPGQGVYVQNLPLSAVIQYLTKYLTKPNVPDLLQEEVSYCLKGTRMFQPFGSWHSINATYPKPTSRCRKCNGSCFELAYFAGIDTSMQKYVVLQDPG